MSLAEYAANPYWKAAHLGEFIGALLVLGSLTILLTYVFRFVVLPSLKLVSQD